MLRGAAVLVALLSSIVLVRPADASVVLSTFWFGPSNLQAADAFNVTFNDLNEKLLFDSSQAPVLAFPFVPGDCPDCPFSITNSTRVTWTDFHLELRQTSGPPGTFGFIDAAIGGYDGDVYEGPGSDSLGAFNQTLDVIGLNIPDGGIYTFNVDMAAFELQGTYGLFGRPSTDGNDQRVPGPATLMLMALGLLGLGGYRLIRQ